MKSLLLFLTILTFQTLCLAQKKGQERIDSFLTVIKTTNHDTVKVMALLNICIENRNLGNITESIKNGEEALKRSLKIGYKRGEAKAHQQIGATYVRNGEQSKAMEHFQKSIDINIKIGNKLDLSKVYGSVGLVYFAWADYPKSLDYGLRCLKLKEEIKDKNGSAGALHNIAMVYAMTEKTDQAITYYKKAIEINKVSGNNNWLCHNYIGIANLYNGNGKYKEAMENYSIAMDIAEKNGFMQMIGDIHNDIGAIYTKKKEYEKALAEFKLSLEICEQTGQLLGAGITIINIGSSYLKLNNFPLSKKYLDSGIKKAKEDRDLLTIREGYLNLSRYDSAVGNYGSALENYKTYSNYTDSIFNMEKEKKLTQHHMQYEFDKKEMQLKAEQREKETKAAQEIINQKRLRNGFLGGFVLMMLFASVFFYQRNKIKKAKQRSDELLLNILPEEVAEELKGTGSAEAKQFDEVTVMFTDFKDFTQISEKMTAKELVQEIHSCFTAFDKIINKYNIEKIKTIGDSYMCAGGLPATNTTHPSDVVKAALEIQDFISFHAQERINKTLVPFEIRVGIHTGPVVAGIVGIKKFAYDIWGDTVNTASRMESSGEPGKVNISETTYNFIKDTFKFTYRGKIQAKHKGEIDMYFVESIIE